MKSKWQFKQKWAIPHTTTAVLLKICVAVYCLGVIEYGKRNSGTLSQMQTVSALIVMFSFLALTFTDYIICHDGRELAVCTNWAYTKEGWLLRFGKHSKSIQYPSFPK